MSAVQFQRQLELSRIETAFQILHKLRAGMVDPERDRIGAEWPVEVDECFIGGRTRGEGHGVHHKATVVGAVEFRTRTADGKKHKHGYYAGRLRLRVVPGRDAQYLVPFVTDNIAKGATVRTDGWPSYNELPSLGYTREAEVLNGSGKKTDEHLPLIHIVFSNLKTWLLGTHHGVSQQHLQAYLNEFVFRFNRRFYPMNSFNSILGIASKTIPPTYESLYSGEWQHPTGPAAPPETETVPF